MQERTIKEIYQRLLFHQGPSGWWPANSKVEILLGAILVQNTNWQNAARSLENLKIATDFTPKRLCQLSQGEIRDLIRPSGFYQNKSRGIKELLVFLGNWDFNYEKIADYYGENLRKVLLQLHGIGEETADVLLLYVFDQVVFVADTYARRLFANLGMNSQTYRQLANQIDLVEFTLTEAQDFHGQIDEFGKEWLRGKDRFGESFLAGILLIGKKEDHE